MNERKTVTDEAVEAANRSLAVRDEVVRAAAKAAHKAGSQYNDIAWDDLPSPLQKHYWFMAAAAIQAAAPHMLAEAWDRGYTSGHSRAMRMMSDEPKVDPGTNPYRSQP